MEVLGIGNAVSPFPCYNCDLRILFPFARLLSSTHSCTLVLILHQAAADDPAPEHAKMAPSSKPAGAENPHLMEPLIHQRSQLSIARGGIRKKRKRKDENTEVDGDLAFKEIRLHRTRRKAEVYREETDAGMGISSGYLGGGDEYTEWSFKN